MKPDRVVTLTEAQARFENLVDCASKGEAILITRRCKSAGYLVSMALGRMIHPELKGKGDRHSTA